MYLPVLSNFTMRSLVPLACPSATKMSPLGAIATSDGALKWVASLPDTPAVPSVMSSFPVLSNFLTTCPRPIASAPRPRSPSRTASVTQTFSSLSTWMPCGNANSPAPNWVTRLPLASNFMIGFSLEPTQPLPPQRSTAHTLLPSGAIATPAVEPHLRPSGSLNQLAFASYGLGRSFTGAIGMAPSAAPDTRVAMTPPAAHLVQILGIRPSLIGMNPRPFTPVRRKLASLLHGSLESRFARPKSLAVLDR